MTRLLRRLIMLGKGDTITYQMFAETPAGRRIWVIWRHDREDEILDVFGEESDDATVFVITAY